MLYGEVKDYLPFLPQLFDDVMQLQKLDELVKTAQVAGGPKPLSLQMLIPTQRIENRVMATLFFEPSTRTRLSFESAMLQLGGNVITANDESSSLMKGESISDTIRTVSEYADVIVVRCDQPVSRWGIVDCPVINAGDGIFNHPTQALADLYTIYQAKLMTSDVLKVGIAGDIENSRTIRSFSEIIKEEGNEVFLYDSTEKEGLSEFEEMLPDLDVLYLNRVQTERRTHTFHGYNPYFRLNEEYLSVMKEDAIILNPGPRREEMPFLTDSRIKFWDQVRNGLYIRMAILRHIFGCTA